MTLADDDFPPPPSPAHEMSIAAKIADLREAYEQGASRQPTDEEIEAGAKALYDALNSVCFFSWESADRASRADYIDAMRLALKAIQGKATEE